MNLSLRQCDIVLDALYSMLGKLQKTHAFSKSEKHQALLKEAIDEHECLIKLIRPHSSL